MEKSFRLDISAPNLVNVCIDEITDGGIKGRMYDCYRQDPFGFSNEHQLLNKMEELMDQLNYPQKSVKIRSFIATEQPLKASNLDRIIERKQIVEQHGVLGSFIIHVQYRQNATWQGRLIHVEKGEYHNFDSEIELLKIIDNAI